MEQMNSLSIPAKGTYLSTESAMQLAISEAYKGASFVSPNPMVGAVVLDKEGKFLGSGHHEFYGGPHAEVNALKNLSTEELTGAHVIVTLEPCAHQGKTPSCAKMMAQLPLKKVTYGIVDPNPLVAGKGEKILVDAGISAALFSSEDKNLEKKILIQLEEVCEAFLCNFRNKKIFVTLKMASSLDGQVALKSGESQWITGPESREYVHYLRSCHDAILAGKGTIEFDNPSLNIRHPIIDKKNKVIVIDGEGVLLKNYCNLKISQIHAAENIFWCVAEELKDSIETVLKNLKQAPKIIFVKTSMGGDLNLDHLLDQLFAAGLRSIMVEGGAITASSFIAAGRVNRIYLFQAPIVMGAGGSRSWTETLRIESMSEKIKIKNPRYKTFGDDFMITGSISPL